MWNNGPGSDINEEDNKEVLRRIVRYLARDYGNSSEWLNLNLTNDVELTYRQWTGGSGSNGYDYVARNNRFAVQHKTNLLHGAWLVDSNRTEAVSSVPEAGGETEIATVRLLLNPGDTASFARVAISPATNGPASSIIAINCGSTNDFTGTDGTQYQADAYYVGGHTDNFLGNAVANTDDLLYNEARSNFSAYNIPVSNGSYTVRLKFAETFWTAINKRVFDIWIEGTQVIDDLDIYVTAPGKWVAYDLEFAASVSDGILNITTSSSINHALLNAIVAIKNP